MGNLYLIKNGAIEWNNEYLIGQTDIPLSYEGYLQATKQANFFMQINNKIEYIVCSPLRRSLETATVISRTNKLPIEINDSFTDINLGNWEGLTDQEIKEIYPEEADKWFRDPSSAYIAGAENFEVFKQRITNAFEDLEKKACKSNIIVVTHEWPLRLYLAKFLKIKTSVDFKSIDLPNDSISCVYCSKKLTKLRYSASIDYLAEKKQIWFSLK